MAFTFSTLTSYIADKVLSIKGLLVSGADGEHPFRTQDSVYDDKSYPLIGKKLTSAAGSVDYNYSELSLTMSPGGVVTDDDDVAAINAEYPHCAVEDGKIYPHLHWWQTSSDAIVFTLQYRIQSNGQAKDTGWTTMTAEAATDSVFAYTSGTLNQITKFKDGSSNYYVDMTGMGLSATIQFRLTRTDAIAGDVDAFFFDFHYEKDILGSRDEYVR